jgi:hypothetical protein
MENTKVFKNSIHVKLTKEILEKCNDYHDIPCQLWYGCDIMLDSDIYVMNNYMTSAIYMCNGGEFWVEITSDKLKELFTGKTVILKKLDRNNPAVCYLSETLHSEED